MFDVQAGKYQLTAKRWCKPGSLLLACMLATAGMPVFSATDPQVVFEEALQERLNGDLTVAIGKFRAILEQDPSLQRARLELAVAYYLNLNYTAARREAETVQSNPATPESVKKRVRQFLETVEMASKPNAWTPFVGVGIMYDSNVNAGPDDTIFDLGGGSSITLVPSAKERGDWATTIDAGLQHRYLFADTVNVGGLDTAALWVSQIGGHAIQYWHETDESLQIFDVTTGPTLIAARKWRASLNFIGNYLRLGNEDYATFYGINPVVRWQTDQRRSEVTLSAVWQERDYKRDIDDGRDGSFFSASAGYKHVFPGDRYSANVVALYFDESTDRSFLSNSGFQISVIGDMRITKSDRAYAQVSSRWTDYDSDAPVFRKTRSDHRYRIVLGAEHTFLAGMAQGWTVEATVSYIDRNSNIDVNDYDRTQAGVKLKRSF